MLKKISRVTIDAQKGIKFKKSVSPGTYFLCTEWQPPPAGKLSSREFLVEWIGKCVFGDLRTLELGMRQVKKKNNPRKFGGGNFLLASGCFLALEYMAFIYHGHDDATTNVRAYARRFLETVDGRYNKMMELLWRSFRNGLIHGSWPQPISCEGSRENMVIVGVGSTLADGHFQPISSVKRLSFAISSPRLLHDLYKSFEPGFKDWLLNDAPDHVLSRGSPRLLELKRGDQVGRRQFAVIEDINRI
jgi:hypothetical protein